VWVSTDEGPWEELAAAPALTGSAGGLLPALDVVVAAGVPEVL
jgi:hypothetical protein